MNETFIPDLSGVELNDWEVLYCYRTGEGPNKRIACDCRCKCGHIQRNRKLSDIRKRMSKRCHKCRAKELPPPRRIKHGKLKTRAYSIWASMMSRCYTESASGYHNYGGKGISVCAEWHEFPNFYRDMVLSKGWDDVPEGLSIDRKKNHLGYSKDNCKWSTSKEQGQNRSVNRYFTIGEETKCLTEWCEIYSRNANTVTERIDRYGMSILEALTTDRMPMGGHRPKGSKIR